MTDNGADNPQGFNWGLPPRDPATASAEQQAAERRAAEQAAANRLANEQAAAAQAAALAAQQARRPAAPQPAPGESFLADVEDNDEDDDPFAIFTPPPTEATAVVPPAETPAASEPPAAPWVPGAFTAQQPVQPQPPAQPTNPVPPADPFPSARPTPPELVDPPELVLPPEPKWPLPAQGTGTAGENSWDQPTQATPYVDIPTEEYHFTDQSVSRPPTPEPQTYPWDPSSGAIPAPDPALAGISDFYPAQPVGLPAPADEAPQVPAPHPGPAPTAAQPAADFDSLFGDDQFKEYDDESLLTPLVARSETTTPPPVLPRAPMTRAQRTLLVVAGGLVAVLALVGLFLFGTTLSGPAEILPPTAAETPTDGSSQVPEVVLGPVAPGVHAWDELLGTECLEPYTSPWEEQFTVVDCGTPHAAQMLSTGTFDGEKDAEGTEYPGVDALVTRATDSCESRNVINYGKAVYYKDLQVTASVPATADEWAAGDRDYYCFATRESGDAFNGTIAKTPKA